MQFDLTEEHQMLTDTLRRFFGAEGAMDRRNATAFSAPYHAPETWRQLADLGLFGAFVSEKAGGFGGSAQDVSVIFEEIGRGLCAEPVLGTLLAARLLAAHGRQDMLDALISGQARGALAFAEPGVSTDLAATAARAEPTPDGWRLNGRKTAIYGAPGAEYLLVTARTETGIGLFHVTRPALIAATMTDGGGIADLVMDRLPAECLSPDAAQSVGDALDLGRIALCAEAVGAMSRLIDMTIDYLKQRQQFGRPLASFQALQHRVVDMVMDLEQARSIIIRAVASHGLPDQARHVAMAKNLIGRVAPHIAEEAIQLHGGIGMTWEYPGSHYAKRLVMIDHQLGDRQDHAMRLVAMNAAPDARTAKNAASQAAAE